MVQPAAASVNDRQSLRPVVRANPPVWHVVATAVAVCALLAPTPQSVSAQPDAAGESPLVIAVMDPLAAPLACDCVEGFAQRDYTKLAEFLQSKLGRRVVVLFSEDLARLVRDDRRRVDMVIGKDSVVRSDAAECGLKLHSMARLTGLDGAATFCGLFVVRGDDPAVRLADLDGYRIIFGRAAAAEKHSAALAALTKAKVAAPKRPETTAACSEAALAVIDSDAAEPTAAVISSYAQPLLEGCGTINKGELRVVGQTEPVPFITVFGTDTLDAAGRRKIVAALRAARSDKRLCRTLETKGGFVPFEEEEADEDAPSDTKPSDTKPSDTKPSDTKPSDTKPSDTKPSDTKPSDTDPPEPDAPGSDTAVEVYTSTVGSAPAGADTRTDWPGWRGRNRDGRAGWLPESLPESPAVLWRSPVTSVGLAGVAATERYVLVADRDVTDTTDMFRCLDAETGRQLWKLQYPALGELDYGNAPRATPLVHGDVVYLLGAFGHLHCVRLVDGEVVWKTNLPAQFKARPLTWGMCQSPLIVDGKLIVYPGGPAAALAALDPETGKAVWTSPGRAGAYASFIVGTFGGRRQLVGYDKVSLGGWDVATGRRLWQLVPPEPDDFNVPTPIDVDGRLLVGTENNGMRLYSFDDAGKIVPEPVGPNFDLASDTATAVVVGGKVVGCFGDLYLLDPQRKLETIDVLENRAFEDFATVIASGDRVLVTTGTGRLVLVRCDGKTLEMLGETSLLDDGSEVYSHPALVGRRLMVRGATHIVCVRLCEG